MPGVCEPCREVARSSKRPRLPIMALLWLLMVSTFFLMLAVPRPSSWRSERNSVCEPLKTGVSRLLQPYDSLGFSYYQLFTGVAPTDTFLSCFFSLTFCRHLHFGLGPPSKDSVAATRSQSLLMYTHGRLTREGRRVPPTVQTSFVDIVITPSVCLCRSSDYRAGFSIFSFFVWCP